MWMAGFETAANSDRDLIFTFAPEATVPDGFPERVTALIAGHGGTTHFVRLTVARDIQEQRINAASRREFRKLTDIALLRDLRPQFEASEAKMPMPELVIDTGSVAPEEAARRIADVLGLPPLPSAATPSQWSAYDQGHRPNGCVQIRSQRRHSRAGGTG
jgi:hypothetical protein